MNTIEANLIAQQIIAQAHLAFDKHAEKYPFPSEDWPRRRHCSNIYHRAMIKGIKQQKLNYANLVQVMRWIRTLENYQIPWGGVNQVLGNKLKQAILINDNDLDSLF